METEGPFTIYKFNVTFNNNPQIPLSTENRNKEISTEKGSNKISTYPLCMGVRHDVLQCNLCQANQNAYTKFDCIHPYNYFYVNFSR